MFGVLRRLSCNGNDSVNERILGRTPLNLADAPNLLGLLVQEAREVGAEVLDENDFLFRGPRPRH